MSLSDRVKGMILRGIVRAVRTPEGAGLQELDLDLGPGDKVPVRRFSGYGFASSPHPGATVLAAAVGGKSEDLIAFAVGDRRYGVKLEQGEVCLYDDLGRKVLLSRDKGIVLEGPTLLGADTATKGVARVGDAVALSNTAGTSWAAQVTAAINALAGPGTVTASPTGTITAGSSTVKAVD